MSNEFQQEWLDIVNLLILTHTNSIRKIAVFRTWSEPEKRIERQSNYHAEEFIILAYYWTLQKIEL